MRAPISSACRSAGSGDAADGGVGAACICSGVAAAGGGDRAAAHAVHGAPGAAPGAPHDGQALRCTPRPPRTGGAASAGVGAGPLNTA